MPPMATRRMNTIPRKRLFTLDMVSLRLEDVAYLRQNLELRAVLRFLFLLLALVSQPIEKLQEEKEREGNEDEVQECLDKQAVGYLGTAPNRDRKLGEVHPAQEEANGRREDAARERGGYLTKGRANHNTNREIYRIAAHRKSLELFKEAFHVFIVANLVARNAKLFRTSSFYVIPPPWLCSSYSRDTQRHPPQSYSLASALLIA